MRQGELLKKYGIELVESHNPDFVHLVRAAAVEISQQVGQVTCDDLRMWANLNDIRPEHPNAWGAVFRVGFERIGFTKSQVPSNHARIISIWKHK